jgi:flagellar biosynthetic protein FliP
MVIAMFVGMFALGMPLEALFDALGWTALNEQIVPRTLVMATTMTIGMVVWMRIRHCGWPAIRDMSIAMYLSFAVMYPFLWLGLVGDMAVMMVGHIIMVPAMIVAMLLRKDEYTRSHREHAAAVQHS